MGAEVTSYSSDCGGHVVFYLPDAPSVSCIGDPAPMLTNEVISIVLPMLIFPPLALLGWGWRYPTFRQWLKADPHEKQWESTSLNLKRDEPRESQGRERR